jgi:tetratricopeptide (TPR) repeat protein
MRPQPGLATKPAPAPGLNRPQLSNRPTTLPGQVGGGGGLAGQPMPKPSFPTPGMPNRPGSGGDRPGLGSVQRPTTLPGQLPGGLAGNRPGAGGGNRPGAGGGDRPGSGGGNRPGMGGNRPTTLPGDLGNRPGGGGNRPVPLPGDLANRPDGGGNRPGIGGDRPVTLPGDLANRPGAGGNRPGFGGNRPGGGGNRPGIGGDRPVTLPADLANRPWNRPGDGNRPWNGGNRPGIGGNRPGIGDGNNFWNSGNIGSGNLVQNNNNFNNVNVGTGWGLGGYGGGYGLGYGGGYGLGYGGGYGGWANHWNNGYVNPHYGGWYNGCWGGNWGYNGGWWAPFAAGAATWGLASTLGSWGWGYGGGGYVNPYYSAVPAAVVAASPYDYSQPVVVNNYVTNDGSLTDSGTVQGGAATAEQAAAPSPSDTAFDAALSSFKQGDYAAALAGCDKAVKLAPNDSVIHEVRALSLFALGRYPEAAATLNAVLAVAPGMDWTTLSGLYGSVDAYTQQLRKLEDFCRANPDSAAGYFVLAYHYLVGGYSDMAADALRVVVAKQPGDVVAKRLLDTLTPKEEKPADSPPAAQPEPTKAPAEAAQAGPETDLVGTWKATAGKDSVDLVITEGSQFTWKATPAGRESVAISGMIETARDAIALVSESAGTMAGKVTSKGADAFEFTLAGAPADAKPIAFQRQTP